MEQKKIFMKSAGARGDSRLARVFTLAVMMLIMAVGGAWAQEPTKYTVTMAEGTQDAANWTITSGENSATGDAAAGLTGLSKKDAVTLTYNGRLKVKAVTATTDAAPTVPEGAINSKFTINTTGDKVYFSKGNLQATTTDFGTTWTWGFAENQYAYVGETAANTTISGNGTVSTNGTIDLFSWSTSATYFGINNSTDDSDYLGDFVDWGGVPGFDAGWSTLTISEWDYLINTRSASTVNGTENARIAKAKVCDVQGLILFPDEYTHPSDVTAPVGINDKGSDGWDGNNYNATDWSKMESAGCVFLPITGRRSGNELWNLTSNSTCYYWSSTPAVGQANKCDMVTVTQSDIVITGADFAYNPGLRKSGRGVRLVYRVE